MGNMLRCVVNCLGSNAKGELRYKRGMQEASHAGRIEARVMS